MAKYYKYSDNIIFKEEYPGSTLDCSQFSTPTRNSPAYSGIWNNIEPLTLENINVGQLELLRGKQFIKEYLEQLCT